MKGYLTVIEAKLLQPISETLCSFPTDDTNCCYLNHLTSRASATKCKPAKNGDPVAMDRPPLQ